MKRRLLPNVLCLLSVLAVSGCGTFPYGTYSPLPSLVDQEVFSLQNGALDQTIALSSQQIAQRPDDYRSYALRGLAYFKKGFFDAAIADYSKAISLKPNMQDLSADRGYACLLAGRNAEAVPDFDKALSMGEDAPTRARRALALFRVGRYADAVADSEKALSGDLLAGQYALRRPAQDDRAWAELARAGSLAGLNQPQKASAAFDRYLQTHAQGLPNEFLISQGIAYFQLGRLDQARSIADKALELWPVNEFAFGGEHKLEMFAFEKRYAAAKKALDDARGEEAAGQWLAAFQTLQVGWSNSWPGMQGGVDADIRQNLISAYLKLNAKPALPEFARQLIVQAKTFIKEQADPGSGGYSKAIDCYGKLEYALPWYPDAYYNMALILGQLKYYDSAIKQMKAYVSLAPNAPDLRAAQDKVYEWEAKAK